MDYLELIFFLQFNLQFEYLQKSLANHGSWFFLYINDFRENLWKYRKTI